MTDGDWDEVAEAPVVLLAEEQVLDLCTTTRNSTVKHTRNLTSAYSCESYPKKITSKIAYEYLININKNS